MANTFLNLPAPVGNGAGAAVDVSTMGALKTIVIKGSWAAPQKTPTVNIEINNAAVATDGSWSPVCTFYGTGIKSVSVAARWMRQRVSNYNAGAAPAVNVGSTDAGAVFAELVAPAANGTGAAVDVSALPPFKTLQIGTRFSGSVILELAEDAAGTKWAEWAAMQAPGQQSQVAVAYWARLRRTGVPTPDPLGLPIVNLGAALGDGGGGDGIGVNVEQNGVAVLSPAQTLNFSGLVAVTDAGSDTAAVKVGLFDVTAVKTDADSPVAATIGQLVQIDASAGPVQVNLPAISAANKGLMIAVKAVTFDSANGGDVTVAPTGADTIDGAASFDIFRTQPFGSVIVVSDGASNWDVVADYRKNPLFTAYTGAGIAPIDIDVGNTGASLESTGAAETTQTFNLAQGWVEGQTINLAALAASSTGSIIVEVPNIEGGETGTTFTLAPATPGALILMWDGGSWCLLSMRGFVNS